MIHRPEGMNLRLAHLTGLTVLAVGAGILLSAGVSLLYGDDDVPALLVSAAAAVLAGLPMISLRGCAVNSSSATAKASWRWAWAGWPP